MNERQYKGFTIGQYYKNGSKTKAWFVDLNGEEMAYDKSTLWAAKDWVDQHQYKATGIAHGR